MRRVLHREAMPGPGHLDDEHTLSACWLIIVLPVCDREIAVVALLLTSFTRSFAAYHENAVKATTRLRPMHIFACFLNFPGIGSSCLTFQHVKTCLNDKNGSARTQELNRE